MSEPEPNTQPMPPPDEESQPQSATAENPAAEQAAADQPTAAEMTPAELAEAREYGRSQLRCEVADQAIDLAYLGAFALAAALPIDRWLEGYIAWAPLRLAAMFLIVTLGHELVSLPLSWYSGYLLERRFGLSRQTPSGWLARHFKQLGLAVAFGLATFLGLYALIWLTGPWWWLLAALVFIVVSVLLTQLVPVLILPLFYKIQPLEDAELERRMNRLAEGTSLSIAGVYRMELSAETAKANAMLAGLGRTRRVLMGDTLLDQFSPDEIEVILAHEIGHHVHHHIRKLIAASAAASLAAFWLCDRLVGAWVAWRVGQATEPAGWPVWTLPMVMWVVTAFFMLLGPLQNLLSRRFERQCDRYALRRTGLREAYVSAFRKLARLNKDDPQPSPLEVFLFHSHPPIAERLALAEE